MQDRNWSMLGLFCLIMCMSMALPIYGGSVVNTAMAKAFGWDSTVLGMLVASNMVVTAVLLPFAAKLTQKVGVKTSVAGGFIAMLTGALALSSVVKTPWQAMIAFSLMMGVLSAFSGVVPCQTAVAGWFPNRRTTALSILYAGVGVLTFAFIAAIGRGIALTGDWRFGWHVFIGGALVGLVLSLLFVKDPPRPAGAEGPMSPGEMGPIPGAVPVYSGMSTSQAMRMPLFWVVALAMIVITAGSIFLAAHAPAHLLDHGFSLQLAASSMSVMQIGMVLGNLCFGFLAARLELRRAFALALCAFAVSFAILANVSSGTGLAGVYGFALAAGVGFGGGQVGSMAIIGHYWDSRIFPALTATALIIQTIGSAIVPVLAGRYYDTYGSYLPPIYLMLAANLVTAVLVYAVGREPGRDMVSA